MGKALRNCWQDRETGQLLVQQPVFKPNTIVALEKVVITVYTKLILNLCNTYFAWNSVSNTMLYKDSELLDDENIF